MFNPNQPKDRENETNPGRRPQNDQDKRGGVNQRDKEKDKETRRVKQEF
ncbi:MAG: hypothetical protein AABZ84_05350 [Pseudomonadota bacterium]